MKEYIEREAALKYGKAMYELAKHNAESMRAGSEFLLGWYNMLADERKSVVEFLEKLPFAYVAPVREETVELQELRGRVESLERENADLRRALFCPGPKGGGGGSSWEGEEDRNSADLPGKF